MIPTISTIPTTRPFDREKVSSHAVRTRALATLSAFLFLAQLGHGDIPKYIGEPDSSFSWTLKKRLNVAGSTVSILRLTSQTWKGIPWRHWLSILRPRRVKNAEHALLVIAGGERRETPPERLPGEALVLAHVAEKTGTVVALLTQVPYQPIFGGLKEDALIAYTFQRYLETGDETWPCLLPMTKSAIRGMDAIQAFLLEAYQQQLKRFTVTGASKRGWTTWLTGAADARVAAIAPMVIDTLNLAKQLPHHLKCWGTYSLEIEDYTRLRLPERMGEQGARRLLGIVDPFSYRELLKMPKLILIGTNDRYWPVDAVKLYFNDLPGEKYIHYAPNAGHGLGNKLSAVRAISAFYNSVVQGEQRPRFTWTVDRGEGSVALAVTAEDPPLGVRLWTAQSKDRDFRDEHWRSSSVKATDGVYRVVVPLPAQGYVGFYGELIYNSSLGHSYSLATNVEVLAPPKRKAQSVRRETAEAPE